jgi:RimJ/RimL family protein N-acetyltransferase
MIETQRLILRPLSLQDEEAFIRGIADDELRRMYGFPAELSEDTARRIFARFSSLPAAYGLVRKAEGALAGFLLNVMPELPEDMLRALPEGGRTLAFATFPPYQRQGYMREALTSLIEEHFHSKSTPYIHCGHFSFNGRSEALLRSLGFKAYGRHALGSVIVIDEIRFKA